MPVSFAVSDQRAAGSIATTTRTRSLGGRDVRHASIIPRFHSAPGKSSRISASNSWRPRRVPSYFRTIWLKKAGARYFRFS